MTSIFLLFLSGCWIPESFDIKVKINKDGSYIFSYDGTLVNVLALETAKKGSLSKKDEIELAKEGDKMRQDPDFKEVKYLGSGRCKVLVQKVARPGEPLYFPGREMKILSIQPQKDGSLLVSGARPSQKDIDYLRSIGTKIAGTLTVNVSRGVTVIKHNAQSQPKLFGFFGGYK